MPQILDMHLKSGSLSKSNMLVEFCSGSLVLFKSFYI